MLPPPRCSLSLVHDQKQKYEKKLYAHTQFGWTHITLLLVVVSASCMIKNMFEGMVWFFIPVCLVIWSVSFLRTTFTLNQLLLSP